VFGRACDGQHEQTRTQKPHPHTGRDENHVTLLHLTWIVTHHSPIIHPPREQRDRAHTPGCIVVVQAVNRHQAVAAKSTVRKVQNGKRRCAGPVNTANAQTSVFDVRCHGLVLMEGWNTHPRRPVWRLLAVGVHEMAAA